MNESGLWQYIKKGMQGKWEAMRIENTAGNGMPDVFYAMPGVSGFIELKYLTSAPKDPNAKIRVDHFRPEQKLWFRKFGGLIDNCYMLIRIADEFFLWPYPYMFHMEEFNIAQWKEYALGYWHKRISWVELKDILENGYQP